MVAADTCVPSAASRAAERARGAPPTKDTPRFRLARQSWLDALPIAAAIVGPGLRGTRILAKNAQFTRVEPAGRDPRGPIARLGIAGELAAIFAGESQGTTFEWRDGGLIDGRHFTVSVAPIVTTGSSAPRALLTLIDRTSEVQTAQSLRRQILCDPLTGLANRAGFVEGVEQRIESEGVDTLAVLLVDLSRFARVNECMGSLGGDELIVTVARRLVGLLRGYDLLARTGANEFAFAVRLTDGPGDVLHIARRVQAALAEPFQLSDFEIRVDCAIGCSLGLEGGANAEALIRFAQIALKSSKASGRIETYQAASFDAARHRFSMETELRRAIEREELSLAFQPLMSLATGRVSGFEALARWHHPDRGDISPTEFIAVAEDSALIVPLGRWAADRALATLAQWDARAGQTLPLYVAVNLSPVQIVRDDVPSFIAAMLRAHRLDGSRLAIELTESAIISDPARAERTLAALKALGAMVAMDDFGTGFTNMAQLQRLPIDMLKIDRSFVTDMLDDPDKAAIVRTIVSLAQALGLTTTAEGVETAALAKTLAALGCTTGQGYCFAAALPGDDAYRFTQRSLFGPA